MIELKNISNLGERRISKMFFLVLLKNFII